VDGEALIRDREASSTPTEPDPPPPNASAAASIETEQKQPYPPPTSLPTQQGPKGIRFDFRAAAMTSVTCGWKSPALSPKTTSVLLPLAGPAAAFYPGHVQVHRPAWSETMVSNAISG